MAVSRNYDKINIILNNSATQFAITFDVNKDDYGNAINIEVYLGLDRLVQDTDFTITGKTINYPDAVNHQGEKLTIFRLTPIEQPVDFVDNGNFTLEDIEAMGDRAIMILQEQGTNLNDTVKAQESAEKAERAEGYAEAYASDAEDWAKGTRSDGQTPQHTADSAKHYAESADTSASMATSMRNQSAANALVAEGYAKGTQGGEAVESGDYYQDNSKYYKEQAGLSAGAASGSATSAYNSELAAAASEDKAHDWADKATDSEVEPGEYSAKHWAAKASQSSGSAAVSAYNAGLSETAADTSAKDSEAYAVGTRGGTPVTSDDPAYHNNSKWYNDNIAQQTVTPDNSVTLTNKTIDSSDNTITIDKSEATVTCSPTVISSDTTITPTSEMNVVIDTSYVCVTLASSAPYVGYRLPIMVTASYGFVKFNSSCVCMSKTSAVFTWNGTKWQVESGATFVLNNALWSYIPTGTKPSDWAEFIGIGTYHFCYAFSINTSYNLPLANCNISVTWRSANSASALTTETFIGTGEGNKNTRIWSARYESGWCNQWTAFGGIGSGTVHSATVESPFTGTVTYCVQNGWCFVSIWSLSCPYNDNVQRTCVTGLPKVKMSGSVIYDNQLLFFFEGTTGITHQCRSIGDAFTSYIYPVVDDWVEP